MTALPQATPTDSVLAFELDVTDGHGNLSYAVGVADVSRVIEFEEVERVPLAPRWIRGIVNYQGRIVTVVDAAAWLGEAPQRETVARAIVLRRRGRSSASIGLQVGNVRGVVPRAVLTVDGSNGPCVGWVGLFAGRPIRVLDIDAVMARLLAEFGPEAAIGSRQGVDA